MDFVEIHEGFGRPQPYISQHQLREIRKYTYEDWLQTFPTLMFTKNIYMLVLDAFPTAGALTRPLQAAVIGFIVSNLIITVLWIVKCQPPEEA